jgi:hypothetical protein
MAAGPGGGSSMRVLKLFSGKSGPDGRRMLAGTVMLTLSCEVRRSALGCRAAAAPGRQLAPMHSTGAQARAASKPLPGPSARAGAQHAAAVAVVRALAPAARRRADLPDARRDAGPAGLDAQRPRQRMAGQGLARHQPRHVAQGELGRPGLGLGLCGPGLGSLRWGRWAGAGAGS